MAVYDVEVLRGGGVSDGYIEARPKGVSKGLFVNHAIATMKASNNEPDFVLAIGDDSSDEPMFEYLNLVAGTPATTAAAGASPVSMEVSTFTVTVGKKPSTAQSFVDDPAAVMDVLSTLIKSAQRDRRHSSTADLLASVSNTSQVRPHPLSLSLSLSLPLSLSFPLSHTHTNTHILFRPFLLFQSTSYLLLCDNPTLYCSIGLQYPSILWRESHPVRCGSRGAHSTWTFNSTFLTLLRFHSATFFI
jgi:Trehalose-phosphatase